MHENCHQLIECLSPAAIGWKGSNTFGKTLASCTPGYLYVNELTTFHRTFGMCNNLVESNYEGNGRKSRELIMRAIWL